MATSTLAWGVNTPAHLVIIKGTEFFDAPTKRYVDFPITDILQVKEHPAPARIGAFVSVQHRLRLAYDANPCFDARKKFGTTEGLLSGREWATALSSLLQA